MRNAVLVLLSTLTLSTMALAKSYTCNYEKKDPKGTIEEVMFKGFTYTLSRGAKHLTINQFVLGAADGYQLDGKKFPSSTTGDLNPDYGETHPVAARHEGYDQYKGFSEIEKDVRFTRFEVLIADDLARILVTTTDGVYTEELFSCTEN